MPMESSLETAPKDFYHTHNYRPKVYRLCGQNNDRQALNEIFSSRPGLQIHDQFTHQASELLRLADPARLLTQPELADAFKQYQAGRPLDEMGVWVYYPWSNRVVHLLDEDEFVAVRTNRNRNKITAAEQARMSGARIGVIGLSVGQSVALTMAMERSFGEIRLADFDTLDLSNLNRIRAGVHNIGVPKVVMAAREIAEIDPFLRVTVFDEGIRGENIEAFLHDGGKLDVLVEECDSLEVKILARNAARRARIPVVMDTSDRGMIDVERFDNEPERLLFHGLVPEEKLANTAQLQPAERMQLLMSIVDFERLSPRMKASLQEVRKTLATWPQLASAVVAGGGHAAEIARLILCGEPVRSGRYYFDTEAILAPSL